MVNARDVAEAHLRAAFIPQAEGRCLTFSEVKSFLDMALILKKRFGAKYLLPQRALPKWPVWLTGPLADKAFIRKVVRKNMSYPWRADNSKSRQFLGMQHRATGQTVTDMVSQMIELGAVKP